MTEMRNEFIALAADHITLKPHAKEVLGELKEQGKKIGIATGRMSEGRFQMAGAEEFTNRRPG